MRTRKLLPTLSILLAIAGAIHAEQLVVVESEGAELEAGAVVDSGDPIELGEGAKLTLMSASGELISLTGPHAGPPSGGGGKGAAKTGLVAAVKSLVSEDEDTVAGAFRSGGEEGGAPPEPWLIDPGTDGIHCLPPDTEATLWRRDTGAEAALEIWGDEDDATVWFEEGEARAAWPAALALDDGALFELNWEDGDDSAEIEVRLLSEAPPTEPAALLVALTEGGCRRQALDVLAAMTGGG